MSIVPVLPRNVSRWTRLRTVARAGITGAFAATFLFYPAAPQPSYGTPPDSLTDAEFWQIFTAMSEAGGTFVSENFVSNELSFQTVIPSLQRTLTPGGVYLGVGPEQNFTYIANLKPRMAVIFDIRRQNAMQHLMYKAVFELSRTRADFVARLFSRPTVRRLGPETKPAALFDTAAVAVPDDSAYRANWRDIVELLTKKHGFALPDVDLASIEYLYGVFYNAGPSINYGYRPNGMGYTPSYPSFGMLQSATNADSVAMAFLASEDNYRVVRDMHLRNLIVPVVGDFAGPSAIRSVGDYVRKNGMTVTSFYLSNVEQYLFRQAGAADRFYGNVASLPIDTTSTFIRSVPGSLNAGSVLVSSMGGVGTGGVVMNGSASFSVTIRDSGGVRVTRIVQDSAGVPVTRTLYDSTLVRPSRAGDSTRVTRSDSALMALRRAVTAQNDSVRFRAPIYNVIRTAGLLTSGLVSIRETLDAFFAGKVTTYQDVINMTKTSGWK